MTTALVLSGGGARAAYQVGILHALAQLLPAGTHNPFPIICGTSAGAINALSIASHPGPLRQRVASLLRVWRSLRPDQVYRTDAVGVLRNSAGLAASLVWGGYVPCKTVALLDNAPLRRLLERHIRFRHIDEALAGGELDAVCVTAMHYGSGQSVSFFQGRQEPWTRNRRRGERAGLSIDHLLASAAIPLLFPAVRIGDSYYGDGALRQLRPLSPALRLGADRLFVIGVSDNPLHRPRELPARHPPSVGEILGHMLNSAFIDSIEGEIEGLETINQLTRELAVPVVRDGMPLRPIETLCISPSQPLDRIAADHIHELPRSLRLFLRSIGATAEGGGASAASYLLFEPGFCRRLIALGHADAMAQRQRIAAFFRLPEAAGITADDRP
ncbi:MAG: patatin-like phospholipase family protein [Pseudomonadota bacterium]